MAGRRDEQLEGTYIPPDQVQRAREAIRILSSIPLSSVPNPVNEEASAPRERPGPSTSTTSSSSSAPRAASSGSDIRERCDSALDTLRRVRAGLTAEKGVQQARKEVGREFSRAFFQGRKRSALPITQSKKHPRVSSWTHQFVCLSERNQTTIPTTDREKDRLLEAGLGEKKVVISDVDVSAQGFREELYEAFPKLKDAGGFMFAKCKSNSRCLEPLSSLCLTSPRTLRDRVGNARTYIIPMQRNLDLSATCELPPGPMEKCLSCMCEVPITDLCEHLAECERGRRQSDDTSSQDCSGDAQSQSPGHYSLSSDDEFEFPTVRFRKPLKADSLSGGSDVQIVDEPEERVDTEDIILSHVLTQSLREMTQGDTLESSPRTLQDILEKICKEVDEYSEYLMEVRREHILSDCLRNVASHDFHPTKCIKAVFIGEEGEDGGGPRRELWRLFGLSLQGSFFEGVEGSMVLRHDTVALQSNSFYKIGCLMATSIAQGGSGFPYIHKGVYEYLTGKDPNNLTLDYTAIPDYEVRVIVGKISSATTEEEIQMICGEAIDVLMGCGFNKPPSVIRLQDKTALVKALLLHHLILRSKAELDQLKEGLRTLGMADAMQSYPDLFEPLFTAVGQTELTPASIKSLFLGRVSFSASGTNRKEKEMATYMFFADYLEECRGGGEVSLEDILSFFSGASNVPPLGFDISPSLLFDHEAVYPTASTCALQLTLPTRYSDDYNQFKSKMTQAFTCHGGFGLI